MAAHHKQLCRTVIDLLGVQRFDHAQLVGDTSQMREQLAQPHPTFAMLLEFVLRPKQTRSAADKGKLLSLG